MPTRLDSYILSQATGASLRRFYFGACDFQDGRIVVEPNLHVADRFESESAAEFSMHQARTNVSLQLHWRLQSMASMSNSAVTMTVRHCALSDLRVALAKYLCRLLILQTKHSHAVPTGNRSRWLIS